MVMRDWSHERRQREEAREAEFDAALDDLTEKEILWAIYERQGEMVGYLKTCATAAAITIVLFVLSLIGLIAALFSNTS